MAQDGEATEINTLIEKYRFYEKPFPDMGDVLMGEVLEIGDSSATVALKEYPPCVAMLQFTEVTRLRIRSITKAIRLKERVVVNAIRVNPEKGYVDVSKKDISEAVANEYKDTYLKNYTVHRLLVGAAARVGHDPQDVLEKVAWPLHRKGNAYAVFESIKRNEHALDEYLKELPPKLAELIVESVKKTFEESKAHIELELTAECFTEKGVDTIREVLLRGKEFGMASEPKMVINIHSKSAPEYRVWVDTVDREAGRVKLLDCFASMKQDMEKEGGIMTLKVQPAILQKATDVKKSVRPS